MKTLSAIVAVAALMVPAWATSHGEGKVKWEEPDLSRQGRNLELTVRMVLDSVRLGSNEQLYLSPVISDSEGNEEVLPALLLNGRNMHIAWQRGTIPATPASSQPLADEMQRRNGTEQSYDYHAMIPFRDWMLAPGAQLAFVTDTCGCGHQHGRLSEPVATLDLNPWKQMERVYQTPAVALPPVRIHNGSARVQFEVDRTELHAEPYRARNGQRIDNRAQLKVIDDSVQYALSDPNVEIAKIRIVGYASPESPYDHNSYLAFNRSKALVEYLADKYNLPPESREYDAVPENWVEFRETVVSAPDITETQRADLLELIDRPATTAQEYDAKERELKTSPKFAKLYKEKILPQWFPRLRATRFEITTRLRPLTDDALAQVMATDPSMMSLDQMMRVARLYSEDSPEFRQAIGKILEHYPDDPVANLNAAAFAIADGDAERAAALLEKAGDSPEAQNLRGILATGRGDIESAREAFAKAPGLEQARKNLEVLDAILTQ